MRHPLLLPLGLAFGAAASGRAWLYGRGWLPQARLDAPVVSVGNLSVGGSGKTPVVAWIAERLRQRGAPVAILSRGYSGSFRGECLVVSDGRSLLARADEAGDEPVMLARALPDVVVAVGRRRDIVGREVLRRFGRRVLVLDDGFQHLRLARDLDVLCLTPDDLADWPLPAGRLREFRGASSRADVSLLLLGPGQDAAALSPRGIPPAGLLRLRRSLLGLFTPSGDPAPRPERAFLLSGIARPAAFGADAAACAGAIAGHAAFRDHHRFRERELRATFEEARAAGADAVVTTEKDLARLDARQLPDTPPLLVLRSSVEPLDAAPLLERLHALARAVA